MFSWLEKLRPPPVTETRADDDPVVVEALHAARQFQIMRAELRAGQQERSEDQDRARQARDHARALIERNHIAEALAIAMQPRKG